MKADHLASTQPARRPLRLALVTNIPAPYRVPVMNQVAATPGIELHVLYAKEREPNRDWDLPAMTHAHTFLEGRMYERAGRYVHDNPDVYDKLKAFRPDVVVTTGFNPTHLYAFAYCVLNHCKHIAMTDGTDTSEAGLSRLHRSVRRFVFARTSKFIAASEGGRRLFRKYGVRNEDIFLSPLCANTTADWDLADPISPGVDFLFSGRLVEIKNPEFALRLAEDVATALGRRVSIALLGSGPMEPVLRSMAADIASKVDVRFAGQVSQVDMPSWFRGASVFLFPTRWDPWGVVANEACMAGLPVLVSPFAGVAGELVVDGVNGRILALDRRAWVDAAAELLTDSALRARMGAAARVEAGRYSVEAAAAGIVEASRAVMRPTVVCVQRRLPHYRVSLFNEVRRQMLREDVAFELVYGPPAPSELSRQDSADIDWALNVPTRYFLGERLCWQRMPGGLRKADLVILPQENRMLQNHLILAFGRIRRVAFWGHGKNFQAQQSNALSEWIKRKLVNKVDWWFAYSNASVNVLKGEGFPAERITNLENAHDSTELRRLCDQVTVADIDEFRIRWDIGDGPLGLFIGSLYKEKRLDFLIDAGERLARHIPGFHLMIVGSGPEQGRVQAAAKRFPWLRYDPVKFGVRKAVCLRASTIIMNPGLVGLGIIDSFASGRPMVTTDCGIHSPEIDFLRHDENGLLTPDTLDDFVKACEKLFRDEAYCARLAASARADAAHYTLENMVRNFRLGILAAIKSPRQRS